MILKIWASFNQKFSEEILLDKDDGTFYILRATLPENWVQVSPVEDPLSNEEMSGASLISMNAYISENFRDFSGKFQDNFTEFQNNFKKGSQNFKSISENFNEISQDFRPILENCSEISRKIQKKVSNPKSKSRQKALQYLQEAKLAARQNDVYEAKLCEKRLLGTLGTLENLEANRAKYARKQRNRRQMKIAVVFTIIVSTTAFGIIQGIEYKYRQFVAAKPLNIDQEIEAFATAYKIKVWEHSRKVIAKEVAKGKDLKQTVDSVLTKNYKIRK